MHLKKIYFIILVSLILSSCVLIQESRNKKKLAEVEYVKVHEEVKDTFKVTEDKKVEIDIKKTQNFEDSDKIWYHPNPWWRISSKPFPANKDSIKYVRNAPQYGYSNYISPLTNKLEKGIWNDWQIINHQQYNDGQIVHNWQWFITLYKDVFSKHPEYLAEINGKRVGYGNSSKLCVTNKDVQKLYVDYTIQRIKDNPQFNYFSVEPSDGANYCTCNNCSKLGTISNQVFYLANQIAKEIKKTHPDKQLGLYAYYTHSARPNFKLEDNIKVLIAPQGFQTIYSPMGMLFFWNEVHDNLGLYEYFGIPQWTGDLPIIPIQSNINRIKYAQENHYNMIYFESAANINATLLMSMMSQIMMNSSLTWEDVYSKFLNDCFKESKVPIQRLFNRWHSSSSFNTEDINLGLFDLNEASQLTKNANEIQRIRDLKAYIHYLILYDEWTKDRTNTITSKNYFDYLYNSSNRNIVNVNALTQIYVKNISIDKTLKSRYTYSATLDKNWIEFITDQKIEANFQKDLKSYPPKLYQKATNQQITKAVNKIPLQQLLENFSYSVVDQKGVSIYSRNLNITITPTYTQKDIKPMISIFSKEGVFVQQKLLNNNESWTVQLPESGVYTIMQHRVGSVLLNLKGKFSPVLVTIPKTLDKELKIKIINDKSDLELFDKTKSADKISPIYIITK